jgi:HlyD family secretion protein
LGSFAVRAPFGNHAQMKYFYWMVFLLGILVAAAAAVGYVVGRRTPIADLPQSTSGPLPAREPLSRILAQGRLVPGTGLINVFAPPNQRVERILVVEGQEVVAGQTELATFAGQTRLQLQAQLARAQVADTSRELEQKIALAELQRRAAVVARQLAQLRYQELKSSDLLSIPQQQLLAAEAKLRRLEVLAQDPQTEVFVATTALEEQRLAISEARIQLEQAGRQQEAAIRAAELELEAAGLAGEQADAAWAGLVAMREQGRTLELSATLADLAVAEARLVAPISGTVLRLIGRPGEVALHSPLLQVGDVSRMTCVAEVPDRLVGQVQVGQEATISAAALARTLRGQVTAIGRVVGDGHLPDPNPLALVDRRTVDVMIEIVAEDRELAADLVNLQVTVAF